MPRSKDGWGDTYCTCGHKFRLHKLKDRCDHEGCPCPGYILDEYATFHDGQQPPEAPQ